MRIAALPDHARASRHRSPVTPRRSFFAMDPALRLAMTTVIESATVR
jgi:hypothetical protein